MVANTRITMYTLFHLGTWEFSDFHLVARAADLTRTLSSNDVEAGAQDQRRIILNLSRENAVEDPRPSPDLTWTLASNVGKRLQDSLLEPSHDSSALRRFHPELAERLELLADLEPDWYGYGSVAIARSSVRKCTRILVAIDRHIFAQAGEPFAAPMADGGIELEWDCVSSKELMLVIPPEGTPVRYLLTSCSEGDGVEENSGEFTTDAVVNTLLESILQ